MATVYLAHDLKHDRKVAIKVLRPELAAALGADRFLAEIKTTASLQHPHILPLFDSGEADGQLFYVMPFVAGETVRERLNRENQFGVDEAIRIARDVLDALDYAHRHGVIHRDIKPENILLHDGSPMVTDFGIALAVSAAAATGRMTETGISLGTPHYMSPEQATAEKNLTPRTDIYSLAAVLYEMLTGEPPHGAGSAQAVIMKIITEPVRPVNERRRSVPSNVVAAVAKALEKLPADRFETAKAFGDAMVNPAFNTGARTAAVVGRSSDVPREWFWISTTVAILSLGGLTWSWRRSTDVPRSVTRLVIAFPDSQRVSDGGGGISRMALSPDGRTIAYVGPGASASSTRLWVRPLDQLRATPLAETEGAITPSFSPDGKRIAFVSGTPISLRVIAVGGGPPVTLADSDVWRGGVSWGSDGYIYYDGGGGIIRVRETGGRIEEATIPDSATERFHVNPSALPNGRGVLFTIVRNGGPSRYDIGVLDSRTHRQAVLAHGVIGRYAGSGHLVYVTADGLMMAAPFDLSRLRVTGDAVPVAQKVALGVLSAGDVAISSAGTLLYSAGKAAQGDLELVWVERNGKATAVDTTFTKSFMGRMRLSPDGKQAAISGPGETGRWVWVKQLDRGPATHVPTARELTPASWSTDGKRLLMTTPKGLVIVPSDGSGPPKEFDVGHITANFAEWFDDGKGVVYVHADSIFAMRTSGDTTKHVLVTGARPQAPTVSPNGQWLAYTSEESGRAEVYVRPFPDTKALKRQVSVAGGSAPRWSHDGRELFFVDESRYMVAASIAPGRVFLNGEPRRLFDASAYNVVNASFDVAPDGRFLMLRSIGGPHSTELVLVQNFLQELESMVKSR
jgi:serine/threonine-protein kinase